MPEESSAEKPKLETSPGVPIGGSEARATGKPPDQVMEHIPEPAEAMPVSDRPTRPFLDADNAVVPVSPAATRGHILERLSDLRAEEARFEEQIERLRDLTRLDEQRLRIREEIWRLENK